MIIQKFLQTLQKIKELAWELRGVDFRFSLTNDEMVMFLDTEIYIPASCVVRKEQDCTRIFAHVFSNDSTLSDKNEQSTEICPERCFHFSLVSVIMSLKWLCYPTSFPLKTVKCWQKTSDQQKPLIVQE